MLKIRLTRIGKKHDPHYRIVVIPARTKREGRAVETLGHYNPKTKDLQLDIEKAKYWLSVGAQPTATVHSMLAKHKLLDQLPRPDREPKKPKKEADKEESEVKSEKPAEKEPAKEEQPKEVAPEKKEETAEEKQSSEAKPAGKEEAK